MSELAGKRVLMVYAHCDDELVCGWPVLQRTDIAKSLLIVSSDRFARGREWCSHRRHVTLDLCRELGIEARVLDYDSDFYRLGYRDGELAGCEREVLAAIEVIEADYVMTHNAFGEYGHMDHRFLSNLVMRTSERPVLTTDIVLKSSWTDFAPRGERYDRLYHRDLVEEAALDAEFYRRVMRYYETRGVWTWDQEPSERAGIYRL